LFDLFFHLCPCSVCFYYLFLLFFFFLSRDVYAANLRIDDGGGRNYGSTVGADAPASDSHASSSPAGSSGTRTPTVRRRLSRISRATA